MKSGKDDINDVVLDNEHSFACDSLLKQDSERESFEHWKHTASGTQILQGGGSDQSDSNEESDPKSDSEPTQ